MGWVTRRIAGYITFAIVTGILSFAAVIGGYLTGPASLTTTCGIVILGTAFLVSLGVTSSMKRKDLAQKAWEQNAQAWQVYYAGVGQAWRNYYARAYAPPAPPTAPPPAPPRRP
ncbi:MAG: hypothetical protein ACT4OI_08065 [Methanobacteriota archaeon]